MKQKRSRKALPKPHPPAPQTLPVASTEKTVRKGSLAEFLLGSPLRGAALDLTRQRDELRDGVDFAPFAVPLLNCRED